MSDPKIYAAMAAIGRDLPAVAKSAKNSHQGWTYRSADMLLNALHPIIFKHGVSIVVEDVEKLLWEKDAKNWTHCLLKVTYAFVHADGSSIKSVGMGEAKDNGDKVIGKCLTYALKTMLNTVFVVPTEDMSDPDADAPQVVQESETRSPMVYDGQLAQAQAMAAIARRLNPKITREELKAIDGLIRGASMADLESAIKKVMVIE